MSSGIKIYGILVFFVVLVIAIMDFQRTNINDDDIFNATRNTQLSIIEESIEWGELIVNNQLSIDQEYAAIRWRELIKDNISSKIDYQIDFLHTVNAPPLIAVKLSYISDNQIVDSVSDTYSNVVVLERR